MPQLIELMSTHDTAKATYDSAFERWRDTRGDRWTVAKAFAAKNEAWLTLENVRATNQRYLWTH
jgi:hypothetical protein